MADFDDIFSHDSVGTDLAGTTPAPTGTSWISRFNDSVGSQFMQLQTGGFMWCSVGATGVAGGIFLEADYGSVGSPNVDIESVVDIFGTLGVNAGAWMIARYQDSSNYIGLYITNNATEKMKLYKVVSGTVTLLGTSSNVPATGNTVKLQLRGTAWKVFIGTTEEISVTEGDLSASGTSGLGVGDIHNNHAGRAVENSFGWDQFIVTEFAVSGLSIPVAMHHYRNMRVNA